MTFVSTFFQFLRFFRYIVSSKAELILKIAALEHQVTVLKRKNARPKISRIDRIIWVWLRRLWNKWKNVLIYVRPETVIRWHRKGFRLYWRFISERGKGKGKAPIDHEIIRLIHRMANDNPTWRGPRIHGELLKLGFAVSERTVSRYLPKKEPTHDTINKWKTFFKNQRKGIAAMDFFVVPTLFFRRLYVFFIIHHDRRKIIHFAMTFHPTALWVSHQVREAFASVEEVKYLIYDRDSIFSSMVTGTIKSLGIEPVRISFRSPWQNGVAERWVGSCRRELFDHVIIMNENHALHLLDEYVNYYNEDRTHYNLDKDPPVGRPVQQRESDEDKVIAMPRLGGLHHKYIWQSAA